MTREHETFGPQGHLVAQFLDEVRTKQVDWAEHAERAENAGVTPAMDALTHVTWPRAVLDAVDTAGLEAFASLGLSRSDFRDPLALGEVKVSVSSAANAIAAGDELAIDHRRALLEPFAAVGFRSAATALREESPSS